MEFTTLQCKQLQLPRSPPFRNVHPGIRERGYDHHVNPEQRSPSSWWTAGVLTARDLPRESRLPISCPHDDSLQLRCSSPVLARFDQIHRYRQLLVLDRPRNDRRFQRELLHSAPSSTSEHKSRSTVCPWIECWSDAFCHLADSRRCGDWCIFCHFILPNQSQP